MWSEKKLWFVSVVINFFILWKAQNQIRHNHLCCFWALQYIYIIYMYDKQLANRSRKQTQNFIIWILWLYMKYQKMKWNISKWILKGHFQVSTKFQLKVHCSIILFSLCFKFWIFSLEGITEYKQKLAVSKETC